MRAYALRFEGEADEPHGDCRCNERCAWRKDRIRAPPFLAQHLVEVAQNYREGIFVRMNDNVEKITGTPALSAPEFINKYRSAFA